MKLNDLPPLDQAEIIANRIANMDALREHAFNLFVARNPFPLGGRNCHHKINKNN
jgi:hypothetical protein